MRRVKVKSVSKKKKVVSSPRMPVVEYPALPAERKEPERDIRRYLWLLYGREKIGKTTWFASWPDALFLATEPGVRGHKVFSYNSQDGDCKSWEYVKAAADLLERTDKFKTVVVDSIDRAYDMCMDWVCKNLNIDYPGRDEDGDEDFGKSWKLIKSEFLTVFNRIAGTGRGVCFTSHSVEQQTKDSSGEKYVRVFPSMSKQARKVVEAWVNIFFYVDYVRPPGGKGEAQRVIITQGDDLIWAGTQNLGLEFDLPRFIPMTKKGGYEIMKAAFREEDVGLDPKTLLPARTSSKAVKEFMLRATSDEAKKLEERRRLRKKNKVRHSE